MQIPASTQGRWVSRDSRARWFAMLGLLAIGMIAGGCAKAPEQDLSEIIDRTVAIDPSGSLSVENPNGTVRIYGSSDPELKIMAIKRARTAEQLSEIRVDVSDRPDAVAIDTKFPPQKRKSSADPGVRVDYTLVVPQGVKLARLDV